MQHREKEGICRAMGAVNRRWGTAAVVVALAGVVVMRSQVGWDNGKNSFVMQWLRELSDRLGYWAIPVYVGVHTLTLALCLPYAVFFEAGASMLFGFLPALLCVFSAKILGASLSFFIGRFFSLFHNIMFSVYFILYINRTWEFEIDLHELRIHVTFREF